MNTRFLLPATVATALHALVFFSGERPPRSPVSKPVEMAEPPSRMTMALDEPEEVPELHPDATPQPKGNPDALRPPSDEPPVVDSIYMQDSADRRPPAVHVVHKLAPGPFGVLEGIEGLWTDKPAFDVRQLDNVPRTRAQVAPAYPAEARAAGITGQVVVDFVVTEEGRVLHARVVESSHPLFNEPTLRAVSRWRFEPGKKQGRPVRFRMVAPVVFNLDEV
ncbi:MAG TPA: TonB family protein [Opitutus sp.]|nr:TonB family protein [Opitutus sp.]